MEVGHPLFRLDSRGRCPRCGGAFDCGGMTRPFDCWCTRMPALSAVRAQPGASAVPAVDCLCPACYAQALAVLGESSGAAAGAPAVRDNSIG
ncbi:cysteine-rich CWC family protein [Trinickia sp.]|uniref:cysteine-rich CWC family protein n=1 Tax=Trinickia sp. TaxID=2571163 RepID=UPI003F7EEDBC